MYILTTEGRIVTERYIKELAAKRKEILDAGKDTANDTNLPTVEDIEADINYIGIDEDGDYVNGWAVTDHSDADIVLGLALDIDFVEATYELTDAGYKKLDSYLKEVSNKQRLCIEKGLDIARQTPIPRPKEVIATLQEEYKPGDKEYEFIQRIADDTFNPFRVYLTYGEDFVLCKESKTFANDKKRNAEYWDEIDNTIEDFLNRIAAFSVKPIDFDGYDDGLIPDVREFVVNAFKAKGGEFPYVDGNM